MLDYKREEPQNSHGLSVVSDSNPFVTVNHQYHSEPENSFIYCPDAHQVYNPSASSEPIVQSGPPVITVLMPSSALNGTIPDMEYFLDDPENSLLEVTCQILNITVYPFYPDIDGRHFANMIESS